MENKIEEPTEEIQKPKKPRSQKQIEAFEKARQIRTEKSLLKKAKIKEVKDAINTTPLQDLKPEELAVVKPKKQPKIVEMHPEESSDEEEEIIIKKKSKKPKKKTIIYEESSSSEEEYEPPPKPVRKPKTPQVRENIQSYPQILFF